MEKLLHFHHNLNICGQLSRIALSVLAYSGQLGIDRLLRELFRTPGRGGLWPAAAKRRDVQLTRALSPALERKIPFSRSPLSDYSGS